MPYARLWREGRSCEGPEERESVKPGPGSSAYLLDLLLHTCQAGGSQSILERVAQGEQRSRPKCSILTVNRAEWVSSDTIYACVLVNKVLNLHICILSVAVQWHVGMKLTRIYAHAWMKLTVKEVVQKKFRILQLLSSLSSIFLDSQQVFCCGGKIYTHLTSSVGGCTEILPWPPAHPATIHLTADTGVPLGWSFAFCGIISHLQWWFRQMLHHAGELPSVVMRESMLHTLEIHFKFTFEPQTAAGQQKKSCDSLSKYPMDKID